MTTAQLQIPAKLIPVFSTPGLRYRGSYGGRGSAKTRTFALMTAVYAYRLAQQGESGVILCAREFMNSLEESSMEEIKQAIRAVPWLDAYFDMGEKYIRTRNRRIRYIFTGLRHNLDSIKSKARIWVCWIDEAESVSEQAYLKLVPTVRDEGSELWITWNPERDGSATDQRFRKQPPENGLFVEMNYWDNPFFPATLDAERREDQRRLDPATYAHVWEGAYLENSDAQVLAGKVRVDEFTPGDDWSGPYYGVDWGFAKDPTAGVKCWIHEGRLFIEHEAHKTGLEIDATPAYLISKLPGIAEHVSRADNARPETISHCQRNGLPRMEAAPKWAGSVEDGVAHLRGYQEIVVHPRCREFIRESRLYSYAVDRLTGDVLPKIVDAHNHAIDATRYSLSPLIRRELTRQPLFAAALGSERSF